MAFEDDLKKANDRLKVAKLGVSVRQNGGRLVLRATLPPKPGTGHTEPRQYDLSLGHRANIQGLRSVEIEAKTIGAALSAGKFDWSNYVKLDSDFGLASGWVKRFEADYFSRRRRSPKTETTWQKDYRIVLNRLPGTEPLTNKLLLETVLLTEPDSKSRKRYCMVLGALAKFAGLDFDPKSLAGNYSPKKVSPRDLPTDAEIIEWRNTIPNEQWQYAFGLMACYGLRNHEVFNLELESLTKPPGILTILDGKTGPRRVWPCYPEWWDEWRLWDIDRLPQVTGKDNAALGGRVTQALKRYGFVKPYSLRHRWAVRTLEMGLPVELAAIQMGHSVAVHTNVYHAFITEDTHQKAFEAIMKRSDRPIPPT